MAKTDAPQVREAESSEIETGITNSHRLKTKLLLTIPLENQFKGRSARRLVGDECNEHEHMDPCSDEEREDYPSINNGRDGGG